ncbi:MAG: hypothetical protein LBJ14_00500 [Desulfarculales bacterium]|jgi:hypothetical protein|nr:hypothetical protein [Desulfarculales bacterium]
MKVFYNDKIKIPYYEMLGLVNNGILRLGILNHIATQIVIHGKIPMPIKAASHLWSFIALAIFVISIFLSFLYSWWLFIIGLVLTPAILRSVKKSNAENLIDLGLKDQAWYTTLMDANVWMYNIEDEYVDLIYNKYKIYGL